MNAENDVTMEILRAVQNGLPAETAVKLLHSVPAPAEAPPEAHEPEPVAPSAAPAAPSLDAYVLGALRRDIPRLAEAAPAATPDVEAA